MPQRRIVLEQGGCYHVVSRIVERQFYFGAGEKEFFVGTMRKLEAFLDVRVLTYCVMSNHFHLLVEVPAPGDVVRLTVTTLKERLPLLYHGKSLVEACEEIDRAEAHAASPTGTSAWIDAVVARYQDRLGDLSIFLKELKWRFSMWYNANHERTGTLWEDRFRSVLVEGAEHALMTVAAYIELNPIRAGLVVDPKDYRWCGYGEAVAGKKRSQQSLVRLHRRMRAWQSGAGATVTWREVASAYRGYLYGQGGRRLGDGRTGRGAKRGIHPAQVEEVVNTRDGRLSVYESLLSRVRYFTDGAILGSSDFVDQIFETERSRFPDTRKTGARRMRGADWGGLTTLRDLQDNA